MSQSTSEPEASDGPINGLAVEVRRGSLVFPNGFEALRGIDWCLSRGARVALVGKSGCGKTTLLRVIAGLQELSSGRRLLHSTDESVAYVFQQPALLPWEKRA